MGAVEDTVTDAVTNMKQGMDNALTSGMAFMKETSDAVTSKAEEMGDDLMAAGNDMMKHVPLKDAVDNSVQELMAEKMKEVDQMADDLIADTEEMVKEAGAGMTKALSMVGLPKVSNTGDAGGGQEGAMEDVGSMMMGDAGKISNKTPIQSMDSFQSGSPEPELQKLEEMGQVTDSPKPSNNMLELVDLEATPTHPPMTEMMKMAE